MSIASAFEQPERTGVRQTQQSGPHSHEGRNVEGPAIDTELCYLYSIEIQKLSYRIMKHQAYISLILLPCSHTSWSVLHKGHLRECADCEKTRT